jgi:hypothetical protein
MSNEQALRGCATLKDLGRSWSPEFKGPCIAILSESVTKITTRASVACNSHAFTVTPFSQTAVTVLGF